MNDALVSPPSTLSASPFICPICQSILTPQHTTWQCDGAGNPKQTRHPFDVARQGYVNLLPVQYKKSKRPGDSQAAIEARHRFLTQGHYQLLQQELRRLIAEAITITDIQARYWLDIGCGEGYYSLAMASLTHLDNLIAVDISKPAVTLLARQAKLNGQLWSQPDESKSARIYPIVASAAQLPLPANYLDGISSIFSPILPKVFAHHLKAKGWLVIAKPDVGHLTTMRRALFDEVREHDSDKFLTALAPYFELRHTHHIECTLSLDDASLADLLTMTPYAYRAQPSKRAALLAQTATGTFGTHAKFVIYALQKKG